MFCVDVFSKGVKVRQTLFVFTGLLLAALLAASTAGAQSTLMNAQKYGAMRQRLIDDFVRVGQGAGMSMPAAERWADGRIRWADATIRLGWYVGLLATEHHMVSHPEMFPGYATILPNGVDTAMELSHALDAIDRLDEVADSVFPAPCTQTMSLNGFFIRDDVASDFHMNFPGRTSTSSDFTDAETLKEMSQDQVYHMFLGLALVKHLVPESVAPRGKSLARQAKAAAERIGRHVGEDWTIRNPACDDRQVARGAFATGYAPGASLTISFLTDGAYEPEFDASFQALWDAGQEQSFVVYLNVDNQHMAMAIAATGRGWGDDTMTALATLAVDHDWYAYPLLYATLFNDDTAWCDVRDAINARTRHMLDELPMDQFPASPRPNRAVHGWTVSSRFIRGGDSHYVGPAGSDGRTFPGLDYMLLHNLYATASPELWPNGTGDDRCADLPLHPDVGSPNDDGGVRPHPDVGSPDDDLGVMPQPDVGGSVGDTGGSSPDVYDPQAGANRSSEGDGGGCVAASGRFKGDHDLPAIPLMLLLATAVRRRRKWHPPK